MPTARRRSPRKTEPAVHHRGHRLNVLALKRALAERGLSQRQLAKKADVSEATIAHAMGGQYLDPMTVRKLAKTLASIPVIESAAELLDVS